MNTRFPWMILLLVTGFIRSGTSLHESCDGISVLTDRISINSDENFKVNLTKSAATGDDGIDVYLTIEDDCAQTGIFSGGFKIGQLNSKETCDVEYTWDTGKNTFAFTKMDKKDVANANFTLSASVDAPHQARVELRQEGTQLKMIVSYPENVALASSTMSGACWSAGNGQFQLTFDALKETAKNTAAGCRIVSELIGDYHIHGASVGDHQCNDISTPVETTSGSSASPPGTSDTSTLEPNIPSPSGTSDPPTLEPNIPSPSGTSDTPTLEPSNPSPSGSINTTTSGSSDDEKKFPLWAIAVIIIVVILLLAIVGVVIYIFCCRKSEATDEDVEEGSKEEDGEKPAQPADGTNEADGKGSSDSDPTQPGSDNSQD